MKKLNLFILIAIIIILQGCALQVGLLNPKPNLDLKKTNQSIHFVIDNGIQNSFYIPKYSGIKKSKVTDWRTSLKNGFNNGFKDFYKINTAKTNSDFILKLLKTDVKFIPTSMSGYNNLTVLKVQIKFKAQLLNSAGEELNKVAGTAVSKKTINIKGQENKVVENAIENMYKIISEKFFK